MIRNVKWNFPFHRKLIKTANENAINLRGIFSSSMRKRDFRPTERQLRIKTYRRTTQKERKRRSKLSGRREIIVRAQRSQTIK